MVAPALRVVQLSDLHLIEPASLQNYLQYLSTLPAHALALTQLLQREDQNISSALATEVQALCSDLPSIVALTGDISTWPGDPAAVINRHQYPLVLKLPPPVFAILGNHDWGPAWHSTSYSRSKFQRKFAITAPRCEVLSQGPVNVVVFMVDSNIRMFPCQGRVDQMTRDFLSDQFTSGRKGNLLKPDKSRLTAAEYDDALKILLLHHMPLERADYKGALSRFDYWLLQLRDRPGLLTLCKDDIDIMLFGHTHVPLAVAENGFVMVNCGTTTGLLGGTGGLRNNIQRLTVYDDLSVDVQQFNWDGLRFVGGPRSAPFRRGGATGNVVGAKRWG
jgi:3',5'-cyclic AMP phosphodiesterase CpdA